PYSAGLRHRVGTASGSFKETTPLAGASQKRLYSAARVHLPCKTSGTNHSLRPLTWAATPSPVDRGCSRGYFHAPMSIDLQAINTSELKSRVGELRRYL